MDGTRSGRPWHSPCSSRPATRLAPDCSEMTKKRRFEMKPYRSVIALSLVNLSVLLLAGAARAAAAVSLSDVKEGELLFRTGEPGVYEPAPVLASDIHVEVAGIVARSRVTQIFKNPTDHFMEAVYVFPLAENAAVDGLHMVIGERVVEGKIAENGEAKKAYEEATEAGKK